ncbi:hypothetical protein HYW53_03630 [Candidatus Giovannonibacteria bacterium]|nr:hypothetical protein [Candidatus Giovannonibacteria bacterium]
MINLLPQEDIKKLKRERFARFLMALEFLIAIAIFISTVLILPVYFSLLIEKTGLERGLEFAETSPELKEVGLIEKTLKEFNSKLSNFEEREREIRPVASNLKKILEKQNSGIAIESLNYERKAANSKEIIFVEGVAQRRDDFLVFLKNLESVDAFKKVESPVSNLLKDSNAPFSLTLELK